MKVQNPKLVVGTAFLVLSLIIILVALNIRKQTLKSTQSETPADKKNEAKQVESFDGEVVAKVGEEDLYIEDLEYELSFFPASPSAAVKGAVINKMLKDSIILQAASKEKLITLDDKVFNARNKNYRLRLRLVDLVKKEVNKKSASLEGKAVVIWFQNMTPGELGYEKGREVAFEKISGLQTLVKKGSLTIEKAIEAVQKDSSLIEIDSSYEANASIDFNLGLREPITIDPDVDEAIRKLKPGEVTDVLTGDNISPGPTGETESFFVFAQVKGKSTEEGKSYDEWVEEQLKQYETEIY